MTPDSPSFDPGRAARILAEDLRAIGSPERAAAEQRYLKSDLEFFGVTVPEMRRVVTAAVRRVPGLDREAALAWAVALWREPVHERRMAAVEVLRLVRTQLRPDDLATVEELIRDARTWALVDSLAGDIAGVIALRHPAEAWPRVDGWAGDPDFWVRRSALLTLLPGIRADRPDLARLERYALGMLAEKEFFIRKAIGWVLRETSKRDPEWVATWTAAHVLEMSGVTFREATRRLSPATTDRLRTLREGSPRG